MEPVRRPSPVTRLTSEDSSLLAADCAGAMVSDALRLVAMREHTLLSLSELSQELTISLDLFSLVDLVLFNLMGQLGTSRSAMWLLSDQGSGVPILVRSHGINRQMAKALGTTCTSKLLEHLSTAPRPLPANAVEPIVGAAAARMVERTEIALFAAVAAREERIGLLALGPRVGGEPYESVDLQALQASLAMVGVAIQNMSFYNRLLENNRQLRLANENLKNLDRLKTEFLSNVNHELRTPLTNIIAYVDCLMNPRREGEYDPEFLKVVMEEAVKLQGLLEDLLTFSAATQDKLTVNLETGDVTVPLARYYEERLPGVSEGLRELLYTWEPELPQAQFDEKRLLQIVDSLIENAVKFTPEGSRIRLQVRKAFDEGRTWVVIEVEDDGPGIPRDRLPALFEAFQQVDGSSTRTVGGMGIGLALAREIAAAMGGSLSVSSEIGKGSTFTLLLPTA